MALGLFALMCGRGPIVPMVADRMQLLVSDSRGTYTGVKVTAVKLASPGQ